MFEVEGNTVSVGTLARSCWTYLPALKRFALPKSCASTGPDEGNLVGERGGGVVYRWDEGVKGGEGG